MDLSENLKDLPQDITNMMDLSDRNPLFYGKNKKNEYTKYSNENVLPNTECAVIFFPKVKGEVRKIGEIFGIVNDHSVSY